MSWWDALPPFLAVLTIGLIPGIALSLTLGLRGIAVLGSAPAFSVTAITLASVAAPYFNAPWGLAPIAATTTALLIVVVVFRAFWHRLRPQPTFAHPPVRLLTWAAIGVGVAATVITARFIFAFGEPENISQTYDNIFHLNALRYVLDTGNASPLTLGGLNIDQPGTGTFYPAGWHALTAAVTAGTGISIAASVNLVSILVGAVYWPLSCIFFVRTVVGPRAIAVVGAGVLSAAFGAFPYGLIDFGVVYPFLLAMSILPAALAYGAMATGISEHPQMRISRARFALLGVLPGIALAHPSVVMAFVAFSTIMVARGARLERRKLITQGAPLIHTRLTLAGAIVVIAAFAAAWLVIRVSVAWQPTRTVAQAIGEALTSAPNGLPVAWVVTALTLIGVSVALRRSTQRWLLLNFALAIVLYVAAAAMPHSPIRALLVGTWYGDSHRLAALLTVAALPVAVLGLVWLYDRVRTHEFFTPSATPARSRALAVVAAIAVLVATQGYAVHIATIDARGKYVIVEATPDSDGRVPKEAALLTANELDVLENVDQYVPEGSVVAGNPWTGAGLVYAFSDRRAMLPHVGGFDTPQTQLIGEHLRDADRYTIVCDALTALKIEYALDFGVREVHGDQHNFGGLTELSSSTAVKAVYTSGDVGLYKITACD